MTRLSYYTRLIAGGILCLSGLSSPAHASSLSVTPVLVTLDARHQSISLTIHNESAEAKVIQTELVRWTQHDGSNIYTSSRDLLINPPIFTLQPDQIQIVRIGLKRKANARYELAYRLRITEVPPPPKPEFTGLRIALRFDIPVFVAPKATQSNRLSWKASRNSNGEVLLDLRNLSNHHVQVKDIKLGTISGGKLLDWQPMGFVLLSRQTRQIKLKPGVEWNEKQLEFTAHINEGLVTAKVELEPDEQGRIFAQ